MANSSISRAWVLLPVAIVVSCSSPTTPAAPRITRLELIAPRTMAPGTAVQLQVRAHRSDGSTEDITSRSTFSSDAANVVAVTPGGLASALTVGESRLSGFSSLLVGMSEVISVPVGTFRLTGRVVEEGSGPVADAKVEIAGSTLSAPTNYEGLYWLYGVPAQATLHISKTGYAAKAVAVALTDHQAQDIAISFTGARADASGIYQLTIEAGPECRAQLPDSLLTRQYTAAISQVGWDLQAVLTGATFWQIGYGGWREDRTTVPGVSNNKDFVLNLLNLGHCEATQAILEVVDEASMLEIAGTARLSPNGRNYTGTLAGSFSIVSPLACNGKYQMSCNSSSHRVTLSR